MTYEIVSFTAKWLTTPRKVTREQVQSLEQEMIPFEEEVCQIKHHFSPGVYSREMFMPKGSLVVGAIHKHDHLVIVVGDIETVIDGELVRLKGHNTFLSKKGAKRALLAYEDSWVTGIFATNETDIAKLENELVEDADSLQYRRMKRMELEIESCS